MDTSLEIHSESPRHRGALGIVAATVVLSCLYFYTGGGWNQAAQFDLVRAIVERGSFQIDAYCENTGDTSFYEGHYYTCKAPGTAFFAVPFVSVTRIVARVLGHDPVSPSALFWQGRIATLACATLPTAVAAMALFLLAIQFGASSRAAMFSAVGFGLGTPAWVNATYFWAHPLATGCLMIAFWAVVSPGKQGSVGRDWKRPALAGLTAGWACISEFQAIGAALAIAILGCLNASRDGRARMLKFLGVLSVGALAPAALLAMHNLVAFGSPFRLAYSSTANFAEVHSHGLLGVEYPKPDVVVDLLLGSRRGLLPLAPILLAAPFGLLVMVRSRVHRAAAFTSAGVFLYYLLFNASFSAWSGGWCYGPRYMACGIPFLCIGLAPAWSILRREGRIVLLVAAATSVFITLIGLSTNPMPPEDVTAPFREIWWPSFIHGRLSQNGGAVYSSVSTPSFNIGEWAGLKGLASLVPLLAVWIVLGLIWIRIERSAQQTGQGSESALGTVTGTGKAPPS